MAECHPVGFQWVMEAKERGAKIIHVDPRFTRTSALADVHVPLRAGTDIAFLGGVVNYILSNGREFREYVKSYTNAATIVSEEFKDTEDLDGLFSGWDPESNSYDIETWQYEGMEVFASGGKREEGAVFGEGAHYAQGGKLEHGNPPEMDMDLEHPRCVFQLLKRHFSRYTPEKVAEICGVPEETFLEVAEALCSNSGRERTSAFCYAVGWTQHTVGVQYIRTAAIIQLLLGNIGRPGGGILALRGHASIQGSTDIPTLYNILPGYIPMPHPHAHQTLGDFLEMNSAETGYWGAHGRLRDQPAEGVVGRRRDRRQRLVLRLPPANRRQPFRLPVGARHARRQARGLLPARREPRGRLGQLTAPPPRHGQPRLARRPRLPGDRERGLLARRAPRSRSGELVTEEIGTEIFLLPAAAHTEKDGSFTNTQRLLQWHHKAVEPEGDCRSDLWFMYHLGRRIREKLAGSTEQRDRPVLDLTWDYPTEGAARRPERRGRSARDQRRRPRRGQGRSAATPR